MFNCCLDRIKFIIESSFDVYDEPDGRPSHINILSGKKIVESEAPKSHFVSATPTNRITIHEKPSDSSYLNNNNNEDHEHSNHYIDPLYSV